ncbi:MAG: DNA repair protein RecO [Pelagibacteraceae bacterium]|nr:DNA repair protein RecO [Pelagibacteraceae bacterium]
MNIQDEGLIIYVKIIKEKNLLIKLLSKENGLCTGIIYGGNSKKNKVYYQTGNFLDFNLSKKNENMIASIKGDIKSPLISNYFNDKFKLLAILSCCSLIDINISENQRFKKIYEKTILFFSYLEKKHWFYEYSVWIIYLLTELGYGFDWKKLDISKKYLNLINFEFTDTIVNNLKNNYIEFPYDLIINKSISYKQCKLLFNLFENIMKNHLINNSSKKIPKVYYDFKQTILLNINK